MNIYLVIILVFLIASYILDLIVERLNLKAADPNLPQEFAGYYDAKEYKKSQNYLKENTNFGLIKDTISTLAILLFILFGGFNFVDKIARSLNFGPILTGLIFAGILMLVMQLLGLLFSCYHTFVLEEKYGFNRTTPRTFILDILKSWLIIVVVGGIVFSFVLWFFAKAGSLAWVYCWLGVSGFQFFLSLIAPVVILPLFNKFVPLEEGALKQEIEQYARKQNFKLKGIFKMDGSRRSSKANAFFTGFGKYRRIALFDTLIAKHSVSELVSVLAHEIGHYKKRHIIKHLVISIVTTAVMFFILSLFIENQRLFAAFKMERTSIYASLFFFGFLYTPISMLFSIFHSFISRRHEYQADAYVVSTYKQPETFISALKKLSVDNLSNLTPHPLKVFLDYSHPPVLKRIQAIREINAKK